MLSACRTENYTVVVYRGGVLAGILIVIVVVAGLAFALPWVSSQRAPEQELEGDPTERFSNSVRILRRDLADYRDDEDASIVSTPLTRRAGLTELRMISRQAARRRMAVVCLLGAALVTLTVLAALSIVQWWTLAIPGALIVAFFAVARFSVVAMHHSLDARAEALQSGFDEDEDTEIIDLTDHEATDSVEISVDLSVPAGMGALWDPIPVAPANYVSKPLLPRTVRTIDLSAPVVATSVVPTADKPAEVVEAENESGDDDAQFRPRAIGE